MSYMGGYKTKALLFKEHILLRISFVAWDHFRLALLARKAAHARAAIDITRNPAGS